MKSIKKKQNTKIVIIILLCIFTLFSFCTIAYSAFSSTMNITGIGYSRVEADVRITDFFLDETINATSGYEEFSKNTIMSEINLKTSSSIIYYNLEITNYGTSNVGIYQITGLPEELNYSIENYNLKDMICDNTGKCNSMIKKIYRIAISTKKENYNGTIQLNFDFRPFHNINYINFTGNYAHTIIDGDSISIDLSNDSPKFINIISNENIEYSYSNNILELNNVRCNIYIEAIYETKYQYNYTGTYQTFTAPYDGLYKVELWGASGGDDLLSNTLYKNKTGLGGYTSGTIYLNKGTSLYVYVGGKGGQPAVGVNAAAGYNGGGKGAWDGGDDESSGGGGGATDVRLISGVWNDEISLKSRIMVAAGGASDPEWRPSTSENLTYYTSPYCAGGGLKGYTVVTTSSPGTQTTGYAFGYGQDGAGKSSDENEGGGDSGLGGGGGGYYGGTSGDTSYFDIAAGGSSFISGHNGCVAITSSTSLTPRNDLLGNKCKEGTKDITCSYHYSDYKFIDTIMIDGAGYNWTTEKGSYVGMPTIDKTSTMAGNYGNGYAEITLENIGKHYNITYKNIAGDYQKTIQNGEPLIVDFGSNAPSMLVVSINNRQITNYTYSNGILKIENVNGNVIIDANLKYEFSYTGGYQTFNVPYNAIYKIELWGASGGYSVMDEKKGVSGGSGSYTSGTIELSSDDELYLYIGGAGKDGSATSNVSGGYNGGGQGTHDGTDNDGAGAGGGATDIRLTSGTWNNFDSLKSRIMVASGGAGASWDISSSIYSGAGLYNDIYNKEVKYYTSSTVIVTPNTTQTKGNAFGIGGNGSDGGNDSSGSAGAGGGYYGGYTVPKKGTVDVAGGGSSFISGHNGCDAITSSSTSTSITHTGQSIHYSNYSFTDTTMIDGNGYSWTTSKGSQTGMPTHDGTSTMTGNTGNGYAKITLLEVK